MIRDVQMLINSSSNDVFATTSS